MYISIVIHSETKHSFLDLINVGHDGYQQLKGHFEKRTIWRN